MRKKAGTDDAIPAIVPNEMSSKESRQNWARLILKVYEVDPLLCPKCQGTMKIISFIEDLDIIEKILRHLELWDIRNHDPPEPEPLHIPELVYDYSAKASLRARVSNFSVNFPQSVSTLKLFSCRITPPLLMLYNRLIYSFYSTTRKRSRVK